MQRGQQGTAGWTAGAVAQGPLICGCDLAFPLPVREAAETERQAVIRQQIADTVGPFDGNDVGHDGLQWPSLWGGRSIFDGIKDIIYAQPIKLKREGVIRPGLVRRWVGRLGGIDCETVAVDMEEAQVMRGGRVLVDQSECRAGDP